MAKALADLLKTIDAKNQEVMKFWDAAGDEDVPRDKRQTIITLNKEIEQLELEAKEIKETDDARTKAQARRDWLRQPAGAIQFPGAVAEANKVVTTELARQTLGESFVQSGDFKAWLEQVAPGGHVPDRARIQSPSVQFKSLLPGKALVTGVSDTSGGALVFNDVRPLVEFPQRPLTIRDVITNGNTSSDTVEFPRVTGYTNNAATVAEATSASGGSGVKPESALALEKVTATVKTIAHWIPATRRALSDAGQIRTLIDNFLRYGLEEELEDQIIQGDGAGENFTGIFNTTGTSTQAWDTNILVTTRKARTVVQVTGRARPNAYIMSPTTWETIELLLDNEARFYAGGPFSLRSPSLWGLPVVISEGLPSGYSLVGDFRQCVLWDREQASITVSDSHSDFFIRNLVAILAEMRAAFGIFRPAAIVEIDTVA